MMLTLKSHPSVEAAARVEEHSRHVGIGIVRMAVTTVSTGIAVAGVRVVGGVDVQVAVGAKPVSLAGAEVATVNHVETGTMRTRAAVAGCGVGAVMQVNLAVHSQQAKWTEAHHV